MATVHDVASEDDYKAVLASLAPGALVTIFFHTSWATPCTQMRTVFEALASKYPATNKQAFLAVDAEALPDISEAFDVTAVPFIVLTRDGQTIESISGVNSSRVRDAVEKEAGAASGANGAAANETKIPDRLEVTPQQNGSLPPGIVHAASQSKSGVAGGEMVATATPEITQEDLHTRLAGLVKAAPVMLFMKGTPSAPQCGFSRQIVAILRERGVRYGFFNILADEDVRQGMKTFADWPTFPQLWVGGELVGGLDIVKEELENNPDFFADYSVNTAASAAPPVPDQQKAPQTATA